MHVSIMAAFGLDALILSILPQKMGLRYVAKRIMKSHFKGMLKDSDLKPGDITFSYGASNKRYSIIKANGKFIEWDGYCSGDEG